MSFESELFELKKDKSGWKCPDNETIIWSTKVFFYNNLRSDSAIARTAIIK